MPYSKVSEARIKELDGVPLTLSQVNEIARMADAIGGDYGWPTAIKQFKKAHVVKNGHWVKRADKIEEKEASEVLIRKQDDGRYQIVGVSTAAFRDSVGETFTTKAMDYEIQLALSTGKYPEFRMFHNDGLGIGKVEKMYRIGPFAVDVGTSYDDPFSLACCKAIASDDSGKWRMSRGFYAREVSGGCPSCGSNLLLKQKHMLAGFKCPTCKGAFMDFQGALTNVRFLKTRTFDDTITDVPCVPYTGVGTYRISEEDHMDKKQLKEKLMDANVPEELIDERLGKLTEKQLEDLGDDIPEAALLKQLDIEEVSYEDEDAQVVILDPAVMKDMRTLVRKEINDALEGMNVEVQLPENADLDGRMDAIEKQLEAISAKLDALAADDATKVSKALKEAPRNARFRIIRRKQDEEDMDDEEEEPEEEAPPFKKKPKASKELDPDDGVVYGANGEVFGSLSESLFEGAK